MSSSNQIRVSPSDSWWKVHKSWSQRDIAHTNTKLEATRKAVDIARNQSLELKIQNRDWKISWWSSFWKDPFPPRG